MGRKAQIAIIVAVLLLIGRAVGAYAYDNSRKDEIASGITVGGVDVGGLNRAEATALLHRRLVKPLQKPLKVSFDGETYTLPGARLKIHANINGTLDRAVAASRDGGIPGRFVRYLTGGSVEKQIKPEVTYSQPAINRFVREVAAKIDREPVDASVSPTGASLNVVAGQAGRKVRDNALTEQLDRAATADTGTRTIRAVVHSTKPKVSTDEVAGEYPTFVTLDRANYALRFWKNLKLVKSYTVAVGQVGLETPAGLYHIQDKQVDPTWNVPNSAWAGSLAGQSIPPGPENPLKARWLGIFNGAGIHGTDETYSLGTAASHGCVRMAIPDVIDLYDRVDVGTPIYIG
jgi:lipoprotein-anchoring transpeptidase ErfK/SrfK